MNFNFPKPPSIHAYGSIFRNDQQNPSPTGTAEHANHLSPISSPVPEKTKTVHFKPLVHVILIPTIEEYLMANLHGEIWSSKEEMKMYLCSALKIVNMIIEKDPHVSKKEAIRQLCSYELETHQADDILRPGV